jgi:hypothetical protein
MNSIEMTQIGFGMMLHPVLLWIIIISGLNISMIDRSFKGIVIDDLYICPTQLFCGDEVFVYIFHFYFVVTDLKLKIFLFILIFVKWSLI